MGVLYGVFHFLRLLQTQKNITNLAITSSPKIRHRVLNHWDNLYFHNISKRTVPEFVEKPAYELEFYLKNRL
ncbi:hypothetical protein JW964_05705 [candidate division KSB1 bacterium]|nr:hypothetical protein [candidate division KSB1 bacterium]